MWSISQPATWSPSARTWRIGRLHRSVCRRFPAIWLGGILIAPSNTVNLTFGFNVMLTAFAAAIMGGFGRLGGTVLAAIALGLIQQVLGGYFLPDYADQLPFVAMLIAIVARPKGVLGMTRKARV
ncbi:MAG: hypothetical protein ABIR32_09905 [Ilumatobacteraceae bacterium]